MSTTVYSVTIGRNRIARWTICCTTTALRSRHPLAAAKVIPEMTEVALTRRRYFRSMDRAFEQYRLLVHQVNRGQLEISNRNLDTGNQTRLGEYALCDRTYAALLKPLTNGHFRDLTPGAPTCLHFSVGSRPSHDSLNSRDWKKVETELESPKSLPASASALVATT